jgi:UbiD family decarboxylase
MNKRQDMAADVAAKVGSLRDFLEFLESNQQFITWPDKVLPEPGLREVVSAAGRDFMTQPAILFDKVAGYPDQSIVVGVHGSFANIALLMGMPKGSSIRELFFELVSRWDRTKSQLTRISPDKARIHENRVEKDINLYDLIPLYKVNEYDGGYYLAKASVVSRDPLEPDNFGKQNVGINRIQIHGPDLFTLLSPPVHDLGRQMMMADEHNKPLKIAVMLGNHPAMTMFAATPVAYEESEFDYASAMMGAPMVLTESGNGMDILADSEMVIEAEYQPGTYKLEGPFGEFPGSYSGVRRVPTFKVTAVSHRNNPIFENIFIGRGWTEHDTLIGLNTSAPIYAQLKKEFPEVEAVNAMYEHGMTGIISVHQRYGGFAKTIALRALSTPHGSMYLKNLIMVDAQIDPFNLTDVMWALSVRTRADDIVVIRDVTGIPIDPAAVHPGKSHKLIIDATTHVPPDVLGTDTHMVELPTGDAIDEIQRRVKRIQEGLE